MFRFKKESRHLTVVCQMLSEERSETLTSGVSNVGLRTRETLYSEVSFCSFQTRYSFHCKFASVNYFVLSLRKEHIRSCIVVVSEREYKEYSCLATFIQRLKRDLNQTNRHGIPHRLPLDHSLMVGHIV